MIRLWQKTDNDQIEPIENNSFKLPWSRHVLDGLFDNPDFYGIVYEENGEILGYLSSIIGIWDVDLMNIAVDQNNRNKGIATKLMEYFIAHLIELKKEKVYLEVRVSNISAQGLYSKFGFTKVGERKKYYIDEDALVFMKELRKEL